MLTLKHFILKQRVLDLYRYVIRASRRNLLFLFRFIPLSEFTQALPQPARRETIAWMRAEFERNKHITDTVRHLKACPCTG
jgi:hypothetical protein